MIFFISTLLLHSYFLFCNNTITGMIFKAIFHIHLIQRLNKKNYLKELFILNNRNFLKKNNYNDK